MIDSHCHLDFPDFDNDRDEVIKRAQQVGINKIIIAGISQKTWPRLKKVCEQYKKLYPCYGLHPYFINEHQPAHLDQLEDFLKNNPAVALGECGLDFYLPELDKSKQQDFFEAQLDIALKLDLPAVIHSRKANTRVLQAIQKRPGLKGMIHSFSGSIETARQFIDKGFYISLGAVISFEKATKIRKLASQLPLDFLLTESDAPDQPGLKHFKQRNEPGFIVDTIKVLAELRKESFEEIARATEQNARTLFKI